MIDPILLGHNQFFGVNHLKASTGNAKHAYFSEIQRIMDVIEFSFDHGVKAMMMSTHDRAIDVADAIVKNPKLKDDLGIYLLLPYAAKYVRMANEKGIVNIITEALGGTSLKDKLGMVARGGMGVLRKDFKKILVTLIDFEMAQFNKLNLKSVFLHDVLTDLILGWNALDALEIFAAHVQEKYSAIPAFCTKNLPKLMQGLNQIGLENPLIMASVNKIGYQVNPSLDAFERCLHENQLRLLAMSTLAAGYLRPKEAYEYLFKLPNIASVVVGVSNTKHAVETFDEIRFRMRERDGVTA